jgi:hypothetical protein
MTIEASSSRPFGARRDADAVTGYMRNSLSGDWAGWRADVAMQTV